MATATSAGSCPRPVCRASGRRVRAWRALRPALPPGRADRVVASASPAGNRVLTSRDGAFHVSYGTSDQLRDISDTQALAFFEPVTPVLDPMFLQYFKADVSVTLDRKYEYLDSRRFAPLVATRVATGDSDGDRPDPPDLRLRGRWPTGATSATMERRNQKKSIGAAPIVGVVELSIQRDAEVTEKLPVPGADGRGVPGAVTPWADGAGAGGQLEVWAEKRAASRSMRVRPGRWRGGAPADEYAYVSCMCVKNEFRRRGVADALLRAAEKVALEWGYDCAALHVFRRNEAAIALYRGRGYEVLDDSCSPVDAMLGKQRYLMVKKLR